MESAMFIRIKKNAYVWSDNSKMRTFLKENEGELLQVETQHLFNDQYNAEGFRLYDTHISEVINDARIGKGKCKYCGKMYNEGEICLNNGLCPQYGIEWFTEDNTFFIKYPKGLPTPEEKISERDSKIGSYYLESYPSLDYLRIRNSRKTINFKYDGKFFYVNNGIGWRQKKTLDIPVSAMTKLKKVLKAY